MVKLILLLVLLVTIPAIINESSSYLGGDLIDYNSYHESQNISNLKTEIIKFNEFSSDEKLKRYLIFGQGSVSEIGIPNLYKYSVTSSNGFFSIATIPESDISIFQSKGFHVIEDFELDFFSNKYVSKDNITKTTTIGNLANSIDTHKIYNVTGDGVKIAIIDTGVDFSNMDIRHSLARDENNIPIMLDPDGQGIVLTNATFSANIDKYGTMKNFSESTEYDTTSKVFVKPRNGGVFLDINQDGLGTSLLVYNSLFPSYGNSPILNGTLTDDMKIGKNKHEYIESKSGVYRLGVIFQGTPFAPQIVPVLVVDSNSPGIYDTIIPDMSTSWQDYVKSSDEKQPEYDFDFTDDEHHTIGSGNEFMVYDFDDDGNLDYSIGTLGAQVLDIYGVINNESEIDQNFGALNGTLLPPMDKDGQFFGLMNDPQGHGTASASTIVSKGINEYDIYNDTKKYNIVGIAPDAKIIPVKALWFGDILYAWLWTAGFDNEDIEWKFSGTTRADIISNSWGVSTFPNFEYAPGFDILSLVMTNLSMPESLSEDYPGVLMVSSAGNSGHGYGTIGLPNASPTGISVGATTNNLFVGHGVFKDEPRFGNTTQHSDHVVDFSSRGPTLIGDPKPDLMSVGAYSFTPSSVTKSSEDDEEDSFGLFGGTSMSAPIVSGTAALVMQSLNEKSIFYDSFDVKNILMSSANDLENDAFTQGTGLVDSLEAVRLVNGEGGVFQVTNLASSKNLDLILNSSFSNLNSTSFGLKSNSFSLENVPQTSWFGGRLNPGDESSAIFKITNPTNKTLSIDIIPEKLQLLEKLTFDGKTEPRLQDSYLNKSNTYRPNYILLNDLVNPEKIQTNSTSLIPEKIQTNSTSLIPEKIQTNSTSVIPEKIQTNSTSVIPENSSLLVLNANFSFEHFMNQTNPIYADDLKISSLYLYDWKDKDNNSEISSDELSLVNRAGSWGTVQELRVTKPLEQFENLPVIGVYPVPERYSFWGGSIKQNSTSFDYSLSASYFKKNIWNDIELDNQNVTIPPKQTVDVTAKILTTENQKTGIYDGFIKFVGEHHTLSIPVSYVIVEKIEKDIPYTLIGKTNDVNFGSEYVKGSFDMTNRYMAGDWRQYYLDIQDSTINSASIELSWLNENTNLSVFVLNPQGKIISTNMPTGVFGHFMNWASLDWLGSSPFSQGGGFFPVKNKDNTSTVLFAPINQTGIHSLLVHSTLFDGQQLTEPVNIAAKFSSITTDQTPPKIIIDQEKFLTHDDVIIPKIIEENLYDVTYTLNDNVIQLENSNIDISSLEDGKYSLTIIAIDKFGLESNQTFDFVVDTKSPTLELLSQNNTSVSKRLDIKVSVSDENLSPSNYLSFLLPNGERIIDQKSYSFNTSELDEGEYSIQVYVDDLAKNSLSSKIFFKIDNSVIDTPMPSISPSSTEISPFQVDPLLIILPVIAIVIVSVLVFLKQKSKIPQKN